MTEEEIIDAFCEKWEETKQLISGKTLPLTGNDLTRANNIRAEMEALNAPHLWFNITGS